MTLQNPTVSGGDFTVRLYHRNTPDLVTSRDRLKLPPSHRHSCTPPEMNEPFHPSCMFLLPGKASVTWALYGMLTHVHMSHVPRPLALSR